MRQHFEKLLLLLLLACTFFVYQDGLSGDFLFDDGPSIVLNKKLAIQDLKLETLLQATLSGDAGPLMRPISMLSFAINYYFTELDPYYFKLTNVVIHLLNGIAVFVLTFLVPRIYRERFSPQLLPAHLKWLALAVTAAWLLHPLNLTSVLYIVQRMTSLSAFFTLWGLAFYIWGRTRLYEGTGGIALILTSLLLFTPLAMLSKENGALLPIFMLITEMTLFNFAVKQNSKQRLAKRFLVIFYIGVIVIPASMVLAYTILRPEWIMAGYKIRDFTLLERLMTEARVLWFYIRQIVLPDTNQMGLFHDDIVTSRGLLQPVSTIIALIGMFAMIGLSIALRKKAPLITFGILFFLAGHVLESTVLPLEIAHEHRNYLPMYGILLAALYYLLYPFRYVAAYLRLRQGFVVLIIGLFAFATLARANVWSNVFELAKMEVKHHPNSVRANNGMGSIYGNLFSKDVAEAESYYLLARQHYERANALDKNMTHGLFSLIILSSQRHKPIEKVWLDELENRLRYAPFASDVSYKLYTLVECRKGDVCKLSTSDFEQLFQAALDNPTCIGIRRAEVFYAQSIYLRTVLHDYQATYKTMHSMVTSAPNVLEHRFLFIQFLIAQKYFTEAKEQLNLLEQLDKLHRYSASIESHRALLPVQN